MPTSPVTPPSSHLAWAGVARRLASASQAPPVTRHATLEHVRASQSGRHGPDRLGLPRDHTYQGSQAHIETTRDTPLAGLWDHRVLGVGAGAQLAAVACAIRRSEAGAGVSPRRGSGAVAQVVVRPALTSCGPASRGARRRVGRGRGRGPPAHRPAAARVLRSAPALLFGAGECPAAVAGSAALPACSTEQARTPVDCWLHV